MFTRGYGLRSRPRPRSCSRLRSHPHSHPHSRTHRPVWLFDLDNTLHAASQALFPAINQAMVQYIGAALNISHSEADLLRTRYTQRYGAALVGLARHHASFDARDFLKTVHTFDDLRAMLHAGRGLARLIGALPGQRMVLTNAPQAYARAVLAGLRLARRFDEVIAIEQMRTRSVWRAKPERAILRRLICRMGVAPADVILVEDTLGHLKHYRALGIRTVWITGHLAASGATRKVGPGRPHYVDLRIRSLKSLLRARLPSSLIPHVCCA